MQISGVEFSLGVIGAYPDLDPLWREFDALHNELLRDVLFFRRVRRHEKHQLWRRSYCRAVSAYLEALTSWMSRYVIVVYHPGQLGDGERRTLEARLPALERAFHAFDLFADTAGADTPLLRDSAEWTSLNRMIRVRNRITHPKRSQDVLLTNSDLSAVDQGAETLICLFTALFDRCSRALTKRANEIEHVWTSQKPPSPARCSELPHAPMRSFRLLGSSNVRPRARSGPVADLVSR